MKGEIIEILHSDTPAMDKLDLIEDLVLNSTKRTRKAFAASFTRCSEILAKMMDDYQFDKTHDDYMGFLNTSGNDGWAKEDFKWLVDNIELFKPFIEANGFHVQSIDFEEFILENNN
jgi:hypothetical protein